jgi:ribokinase
MEVRMKAVSPRIVVVGSFMMDLVIKAERRPKRGETLIGQSFSMFVGGKGFNQALAAARLGADVTMIGRLGNDDFGRRFLNVMNEEKIDARSVSLDDAASTGIGSPVIDAQGDNSIIIVPGANMNLTPEHIRAAAESIRGADLLMMQLEIPLETVQAAAEIAAQAGVPILLNPAPARALPDQLLGLITVLTPNETEAELLTGQNVADDTSAGLAAGLLHQRGIKNVVLTLGARGAFLSDGQKSQRIAGYTVKVIDTTAAGDAFCAGLAVQLAGRQPIETAVTYANAVGALATTVLGTGPAMPTAAKVQEFIQNQSSSCH